MLLTLRNAAVLLTAALIPSSYAAPVADRSGPQILLEDQTVTQQSPRPLHGRFLHITDLHPDQFYKIHSSTDEDVACHRGAGSAGTYGAETSDCDSPFALINATFTWIKENLRDQIDFVVWTGDSARHDSDEKVPRTQSQVLETNRYVVDKFVEVFGNGHDEEDPTKEMKIPIVSTFGNNDILPHNILQSGPNKWLREYTDVWKKFIPEEQRHGFERGGWYYVEVIPKKLAVFSLNTLYFFDNNAAVDGCALRSEPGFEHMEWLRIQLEFMRQRGMKAILTGHVPPARTASKQLWDETCWQKYTLWLERYRDVVVGGLYGHMNIDHFMIHDTKDIDIISSDDLDSKSRFERAAMDDELTISSASDYLEELRVSWSKIPNPKVLSAEYETEEVLDEPTESVSKKQKRGKKSKKDKARERLGGPWGERFQVTNVAPSVVPNFFPTLRIIEYNITGLDASNVWSQHQQSSLTSNLAERELPTEATVEIEIPFEDGDSKSDLSISKKKKGKKGKKPKKPKKPDFIVPDPPSKSSPPGPAYSPQTFTLLGYTQYFANLTHINNDYVESETSGSDELDTESWHGGKHKGKHPKSQVPKPKPFKYEVEYDTFTDPIYKLKDMTVKSYIKLAHRIGQYKPSKGDQLRDDDGLFEQQEQESDNDLVDEQGKKKHKKHRKQKKKNKVWLYFVKRAFVGTIEDEALRKWDFNPDSQQQQDVLQDSHDGEL
ncbi:calcineurin-like phosphoesterase [Phlyctema vagabunda]|uniref:Endopolyphosphatase n=1 Tax=Phlyctema vagabunda TaxID=108571 RepID=A0ABR4PC71_9HELO